MIRGISVHGALCDTHTTFRIKHWLVTTDGNITDIIVFEGRHDVVNACCYGFVRARPILVADHESHNSS